MLARYLRSWWWPTFVFVYPLLAWPGRSDLGSAFVVHAYFTGAWIAIGIALELSDPAWRSMSLRRATATAVRRHPPVVLSLAFGVWVVGAAFFAPDAPIALTGSLLGYGDGAVWMVAMLAVFLLVYLRVLRTPRTAQRLAYAIVASGLVLAVAALAEVVLRNGLVFHVPVADLPMVTFPQKGHLSGMIALAGGIAVAVAPAWVVATLALGIGLTLNRSAGLALMLGLLVPLALRRWTLRKTAIAVLVVVVGLVSGGLVSKAFTDASKAVASASTLGSRTFYYRAAIRGIAARPLLGWGGGNFEFAWPKFLSLEELNRFAQAEWGYKDVLDARVSSSGPPVLVIHDKEGKLTLSIVRTFKTHDQVLEALLMWGIPGAMLYLALFFSGLRGIRRARPLPIGLLVYGLFTLLWFVIPQTQAVLWAMVAASNAEQRTWAAERTSQAQSS